MIQKSPYNLLQEIYTDPWQMMVCCIFLNQTSRKQVDVIREEFFKRWPNPKKLIRANPDDIKHLIKSLGFVNRRTNTLIRMSLDFIHLDWKEPNELFGIGQYGKDSYDIFVRGNIRIKNPSDHVLKKYLQWAKKRTKWKINIGMI